MENQRPRILISNDDGYQAKGIQSLTQMVSHLGDVLVCAPDGPRSGCSCSFTATQPLRLTRQPSFHGAEVWSANGTPVDCVKMALDQLVDRKPDIVLGGINHGNNASVNSHYSGTMGVVLEGCMKDIPSVAFSLSDFSADADFEPLRPYIQRITAQVLSHRLPQGVCLNVNFPLPFLPSQPFRGVKVCRMAKGRWTNELSKCYHPRGFVYFWMVGSYENDEPEADDTDRWAMDHGYVAITPTRIDVTAYEAMEQLKHLEQPLP